MNHADMILESVVTTLNAAGELNVAPMGPVVADDMQSALLRPFQTSTTYQNLKQTQCGVMHVVDDVLLIAKAVTHQLDEPPETKPADRVNGRVLLSACRWYEFTIDSIDDSNQRTECRVTMAHSGRLRDFFGFNRAKHAVLEAAILATRTHIHEADFVRSEFERLSSPVEKTAGPTELEAFELLSTYVARQYEVGPCAK